MGNVAGYNESTIDPGTHYKQRMIHAFPGEVAVFELGKTEKENPFQPPGHMPPQDWIGIQKNIMTEAFLRDGSLNLHEDLLRRAYKNYGILDGGRNYPTIRRILSGALEKTDFKLGSRSFGYKESLTARMGNWANIVSFDVIEGYDITELLKSMKIIIYRLGAYSSDQKLFYLNTKLEKIKQCLTEHPGEFGKIFIIIEESYEFTSPLLTKRADITEPITYRMGRQARHFGICPVYVDQYASGIPPQIWSTFGNLFITRQTRSKSGSCPRYPTACYPRPC